MALRIIQKPMDPYPLITLTASHSLQDLPGHPPKALPAWNREHFRNVQNATVSFESCASLENKCPEPGMVEGGDMLAGGSAHEVIAGLAVAC